MVERDNGAKRLAELLLLSAGSPTPKPPMRPLAHTRYVERLLNAFAESRNPAIVLHDHPDPDAIGSGLALSKLLTDRLHLHATLVFGGVIARAENRALVDELGISLVTASDFAWEAADATALLDCQPMSGNHALPPHIVPSVVIDHHPPTGGVHPSTLADIRPEYGATCTILTEYLEDAQVHVDERLATALFYGIKTDTQDLGRQASGIDALAYLRLFVAADKRALSRIQNPRLPLAYFRALHSALEKIEVYGDTAVARLDELEMPETTGETADLIVRLEGIRWSLSLGRFGTRLLFSLRNTDVNADAGAVAEHLATGIGHGGGHWRMAGGFLPVEDKTLDQVRQLEDTLIQKFLAEVQAPTEASSLLQVQVSHS
ncbi:MAG: DHH family phosphoesterase [Chloroflexi bacterium]|nr:DHH family phosphoesterase [Chloroflexota bacterium]